MRRLFLILGIFLVYWLRRRWVALLLKLRQPEYVIRIQRVIAVPMQDGKILAADHYQPRSPGSYPTVLIRSPYGRNPKASAFGWLLAFFACRFAERGYHVIVQDVRGRFDSDGDFWPYFNEKADGLATIDWLNRQPWFNGVIGLWGGSYLGIVQWTIAADAPQVKAIAPSITGSDLYDILFPDEVLDLGLAMRWMALFQALDRNRKRPIIASLSMLQQVEWRIAPALAHLPVDEGDHIALGEYVAFFHQWLDHTDRDDPMWQEVHRAFHPEQITIPVNLFGGWYDFFLRALLNDYARLRQAGHDPYLTIGPWHHFSAILSFEDLREGLRWFDYHLQERACALREKPVRIYVMGANEWREYESWPPPAQSTCLYLAGGHRLQAQPATTRIVTTYRYDPENPTPAVGGTQFGLCGGSRDNRDLEARSDVITFTADPLDHPLEVIGPVRLALYVRSSLENTDFFGRLCDVYPDGRSINLCDGLFRVKPDCGQRQPSGCLYIEIDMWATAHRFKAGHRIRLHVSSGAHPRWMRNLGTGEMGERTCVADQTIYHDADHPSALVLPVCR